MSQNYRKSDKSESLVTYQNDGKSQKIKSAKHENPQAPSYDLVIEQTCRRKPQNTKKNFDQKAKKKNKVKKINIGCGGDSNPNPYQLSQEQKSSVLPIELTRIYTCNGVY